MYRLYYLGLIFLLGCDSNPINDNDIINDDSSSISIFFGSISNQTIELNLNTSHEIGGFQFTISGATITSFNDGLAQEYGFSIASNPDTGIIIGYSLSGNSIPSGSNGLLTNLNYINQNSSICISDVILSDPDANSLNINLIGDCIEY
tara:strand:- start:25 stop:468 length:444 start_codon:yes stop_codon:yes gene_type:complete